MYMVIEATNTRDFFQTPGAYQSIIKQIPVHLFLCQCSKYHKDCLLFKLKTVFERIANLFSKSNICVIAGIKGYGF